MQTTIENAQNFAIRLYQRMALQIAIREAKDKEEAISTIADILLSQPSPIHA